MAQIQLIVTPLIVTTITGRPYVRGLDIISGVYCIAQAYIYCVF